MSIYVAISEETSPRYTVVEGQFVGYEETDDEIVTEDSVDYYLSNRSHLFSCFKFRWEKIDEIPEVYPPKIVEDAV
jgi:hypothetical protein